MKIPEAHAERNKSDCGHWRLDYRLTADDLFAGAFHTGRLDLSTRVVVTIFIGIAGLVLMRLPEPVGSLFWWIGTIVILSVTGALALAYVNWSRRRIARRVTQPVGKVTLILAKNILTETSASGHREVQLSRVGNLFAADDHFFLVTREKPVIIPRTAFSDTDEMAGFGEALIDAINIARYKG